MNTVSVDGVTYTKAKIVAKKFGYTTDYIGQLCRGGKIQCQLVGRSWYVAEDSLLTHKSSTTSKYRQDEILLEKKHILDINANPTNEKIRVDRYRYDVPIKSMSINHKPLRYESDVVDLLPALQTKEVSIQSTDALDISPHQDVDLKQVDYPTQKPVKIKIHSDKTKKNIAFTEIPLVPLRGKISISEAKIEPKTHVYVETDTSPVFTPRTVARGTKVAVAKRANGLTHRNPVSEEIDPESVKKYTKTKMSFFLLFFILITLSSLALVFSEKVIFIDNQEVEERYYFNFENTFFTTIFSK